MPGPKSPCCRQPLVAQTICHLAPQTALSQGERCHETSNGWLWQPWRRPDRIGACLLTAGRIVLVRGTRTASPRAGVVVWRRRFIVGTSRTCGPPKDTYYDPAPSMLPDRRGFAHAIGFNCCQLVVDRRGSGRQPGLTQRGCAVDRHARCEPLAIRCPVRIAGRPKSRLPSSVHFHWSGKTGWCWKDGVRSQRGRPSTFPGLHYWTPTVGRRRSAKTT